MSRHDEIKASYKQLGNVGTMYDGIVTRSTLTGKLLDSLVWGLDKALAAKWIEDALAPIPEHFSGKLLEVPVGTGVLTIEHENRRTNHERQAVYQGRNG